MVAVDDALELLACQFAVGGLADDVPGRTRFVIYDGVSLLAEGE